MNSLGVPYFSAWLATDALAGPQKSYRLARRLSEQLRPFGRTAGVRADWALAHTLFLRGRLEDAQAISMSLRLDVITPAEDARFQHIDLALLIHAQRSWIRALQGDIASALEHVEPLRERAGMSEKTQHRLFACLALSRLHCFLDAPAPSLAWARQALDNHVEGTPAELIQTGKLLEYWALSRLGLCTDEAAAQSALAALRRLGLAREARGFSLYAQALYWQSPRHAVTQIDAALELNARCGLHHWEARLLHLKSQSLDAAGQLGEASRFFALAQESATRQGAQLFLERITGIESPPYASPLREFAT